MRTFLFHKLPFASSPCPLPSNFSKCYQDTRMFRFAPTNQSLPVRRALILQVHLSSTMRQSLCAVSSFHDRRHRALPGPSVQRELFTLILGRSFLQSVVYDINIETRKSMRAHAPGPTNLSGAGDVVTLDLLTRIVSTLDTAMSNA